MKPLISIIVPIFNSSSYLAECILSILNQSYINFELLLINDGSTDDSLSICSKFAEKDARIVVLDKENSGVSSARNAGLDIAKGDWICFIDSDDIVDEFYISSLITNNQVDVDYILSGVVYKYIDENKEVKTTSTREGMTDLYPLSAIFNDYNIIRYGFPYAKLFKRSIIGKFAIQFDERMNLSEDLIFNLEYIGHIKNVFIINENHYYYVNRSVKSLSKVSLSYEEYKYFFTKLLFILSKLVALDQRLKESETINFYLFYHFLAMTKAKCNQTSFQQFYETTKQIKSHYDEYFTKITLQTSLVKLCILDRVLGFLLKFRMYSLFLLVYKSYLIIKNK